MILYKENCHANAPDIHSAKVFKHENLLKSNIFLGNDQTEVRSLTAFISVIQVTNIPKISSILILETYPLIKSDLSLRL